MRPVPVVYIDVVWLINLVMDSILLWTTGWLMKRRVKWYRILLGGFLGSCYALLLFFPALSMLTTWPGKAVVSVIMVGIALPWTNMLNLARLVGTYYIVSFVLAGASIALGFAIPGTSLGKAIPTSRHGLMFATSGETFAMMIGIPLCLFGMARIVAYFRKAGRMANYSCLVEAKFGDVIVSFTGLFDSGNQLTDPVTHRPVSFVDMEVLLPALPEQLRAELDRGSDVLTAIATIAGSSAFTLVPFNGASGKGLTVALRPDDITLTQKGVRQPVTRKCLFAVYPGRLSNDGSFQAILHMDMVNGDDNFETHTDTRGRQSHTAHAHTAVVSSNSDQDSRFS